MRIWQGPQAVFQSCFSQPSTQSSLIQRKHAELLILIKCVVYSAISCTSSEVKPNKTAISFRIIETLFGIVALKKFIRIAIRYSVRPRRLVHPEKRDGPPSKPRPRRLVQPEKRHGTPSKHRPRRLVHPENRHAPPSKPCPRRLV